EPKKHLQLHAHWQVGVPDAPIELEPDLQYSFGPTTLLRFEGINLDGNLSRRFFVEQIDETPAHQLGTETQIGIFGQRVVLPAATQLDRFAPPNAGRSVEVEKISGAIARRLFDHEMAVEHDRLQPGQQIVRTIDV